MKNMRQAWNVFMQNKFFGTVSIAGTAIIIAFVMVIWMSWEIKTQDVAPEDKRSESVYLTGFSSYRTVDQKYVYRNISDRVQAQIMDSLRYAKTVVAFEQDKGTVSYRAEDGERYKLFHTLADTNVFKLFSYEFVAGRAFTSQEMESGAHVLVLNEGSAKKIYGSAQKAIGKELKAMNIERPFQIVGVVEDVSTFFTDAFSQIWRPARFEHNLLEDGEKLTDIAKQGPSGSRSNFYFLIKKGDYPFLKQEIEQRVNRYNVSHPEFTLKAGELYAVGTDGASKYIIMICVFLMLVPAMNAIGLNSSVMAQRKEEMGLRKAYGATRYDIVSRLFMENLLYTVIGSAAGMILSILFIVCSGDWLYVTNLNYNIRDMFTLPISALFSWRVFAGAAFFCLCFNFMSIIIPAIKISGTQIIEAIKGEE